MESRVKLFQLETSYATCTCSSDFTPFITSSEKYFFISWTEFDWKICWVNEEMFSGLFGCGLLKLSYIPNVSSFNCVGLLQWQLWVDVKSLTRNFHPWINCRWRGLQHSKTENFELEKSFNSQRLKSSENISLLVEIGHDSLLFHVELNLKLLWWTNVDMRTSWWLLFLNEYFLSTRQRWRIIEVHFRFEILT